MLKSLRFNFILSLVLLVGLSACLPDNRDHSSCAPTNDTDDDNKDLGVSSIEATSQAGGMEKFYYKMKNQRAMHQGDIVLSSQEGLEQMSSSKAVLIVGRKWKDNKFYYRIPSDFKKPRRARRAIKTWTKKIGDLVEFIELKEGVDLPSNYIEFVVKDGCWSYVGMQSGKQEISLDIGCGKSAAIHEIGHALGAWHEQSRPDRDAFVDVKWCNIPKDERHNFYKQSASTMVGAYDYHSIMHYSRGAFSMNKYVTLQSKTKHAVPMVEPLWLSKRDVIGMRCRYGEEKSCQELAKN